MEDPSSIREEEEKTIGQEEDRGMVEDVSAGKRILLHQKEIQSKSPEVDRGMVEDVSAGKRILIRQRDLVSSEEIGDRDIIAKGEVEDLGICDLVN